MYIIANRRSYCLYISICYVVTSPFIELRNLSFEFIKFGHPDTDQTNSAIS